MEFFDWHPTLDALELHLIGRLDISEEELIEEHLLLCPNCQDMSMALLEQVELILAAGRVN